MAAALPAAGAASIVTLPGVFRGRELTRKDRRLSATLEPINTLLDGGIPRGRISEIVGRRGCGKTSLAAAFISSATRRGEVTAIIDLANAFDPTTMAEAEVDLSRVLWVHPVFTPSLTPPWERASSAPSPTFPWERVGERVTDTGRRRVALGGAARSFLRAAELVLEAGGFGLLVMDFGESTLTMPQSAALRLARVAERSGTAVLMLVTRPVCGTFTALSLDLAARRAIFSRRQFGLAPPRLSERTARQGPELSNYLKCIRHPHPDPLPRINVGEGGTRALFEGIEIKACVRRNKIGRCGLSAQWRALVNPSDLTLHTQAPKAVRIA